MPPTDRLVPRFAAEPPQDLLPYGRWAEGLREHFLAAVELVDLEGGSLGTVENVVWFPDRTWAGRTYVPGSTRTSTRLELLGYVAYTPGLDGREPEGFEATADYTDQLSDDHPDWRMDLSDEVVGRWRGERGAVADMTLVWGIPLVDGGAIATAELGRLTVDQCPVVEGRFTLLAPDSYRGDTLEIVLFDERGDELVRESLYEDDGT